MVALNDRERQLLERLGAEAKVTPLMSGEITTAQALEGADLVFLVQDGTGGAIITPRGRRLLAEIARKPPKPPMPPKPPKPPLSLLE
jgi:hypothetical protein